MGNEKKMKKLTLEDYMHFLQNTDGPRLNLDQLNQIVFMHGFFRYRNKKDIILKLRSVELMPPARSTLHERGFVTPCAALPMEEVKDDIAAIGWQECPVGNLVAVQGGAPPPAPVTARVASPAAISATAATSGSGAVGKKKRKRRKPSPARTTSPVVPALGWI